LVLIPDAKDDPVIAVPMAESAPMAKDGKTFSLSSHKGDFVLPSLGVPTGEVVPPTLGITPDQFPDLPAVLSGRTTTASACPPPCPPTLNGGQTQSGSSSRMRQAAGVLLTVGAGVALNMTGLHCPICHMMRGHF
jgi:hypothetical protein